MVNTLVRWWYDKEVGGVQLVLNLSPDILNVRISNGLIVMFYPNYLLKISLSLDKSTTEPQFHFYSKNLPYYLFPPSDISSIPVNVTGRP